MSNYIDRDDNGQTIDKEPSIKNITVPNDIAETTIPLGTSFHKDGTIIGSMFKIMFLVCLFGTPINTPVVILQILYMLLREM